MKTVKTDKNWWCNMMKRSIVKYIVFGLLTFVKIIWRTANSPMLFISINDARFKGLLL